MSQPIARLNDLTVGICCAHSNPSCIPMTGMIAQGAATVTAEGMSVAGLNDVVIGSCGHTGIISSSSPTVMAEGKLLVRTGDAHSGNFRGKIAGRTITVYEG